MGWIDKGLMRPAAGGERRLAVEVALEQDAGGFAVDLAALLAGVLAGFLQLAAGLDGGEAFVDQLDGDRRGLAERGGEGLHLGRRRRRWSRPCGAADREDEVHLVLLGDVNDFAGELGVGLGGQKGQRSRKRAGRVAQREADAGAAVVDGEDAHVVLEGQAPALTLIGFVTAKLRETEEIGVRAGA